jgi:hypothetical protein
MSKYAQIQAQRQNIVVPAPPPQTFLPSVAIPESVVAVPVPTQPVSITPDLLDAVKQKLKQDKLDEQKKKKRDYQREYMRKYKKDVVNGEQDKAKKRVGRCLSKINTDILKPILKEYLEKI